jgi:hypothetical protein
MENAEMKPIHTHDCDGCEYLGSVHGLEGGDGDIYAHGENIIARFSDEPKDNLSWVAGSSFTEFGRTAGKRLTYSAWHIIADALIARSKPD